MVLVTVAPLFLGVAWWCCRLFFHLKSGTSLGKKIFHLRLVEVSNFQHPGVLKCVLHDILGMMIYGSILNMDMIGVSTMLVADTVAILFGLVFFGSLLSLALGNR